MAGLIPPPWCSCVCVCMDDGVSLKTKMAVQQDGCPAMSPHVPSSRRLATDNHSTMSHGSSTHKQMINAHTVSSHIISLHIHLPNTHLSSNPIYHKQLTHSAHSSLRSAHSHNPPPSPLLHSHAQQTSLDPPRARQVVHLCQNSCAWRPPSGAADRV